MGSKNKKKGENGGEGKEGKGSGGGFVADPMISDPRFASAHTDPRFRRIPRRESKVTLDSRFRGVLTETVSAPVDKRGKKRRKGSGKDSLKEFYRIEEEEEKKKDESESESEQEMKALKAEAKRRKAEAETSDEEEEESKSEKLKLASLDEESESVEEDDDSEEVSEEEEEEEEEEDTDEDDENMYEEEDGFEIPEEDIPNIEKETHRLAVVNMDWRHVSAKDLYVIFCSFVPKDGRILSVTVYPTKFGLERMKEEEIHGPKIDIGEKNEDDDDDDEEEEEDEDVINQKLRAYEISRLKYYFAVVECDSVATADFIYKSCDGIEFERSSNKLDIRFIPDYMEFKHPPRDTTTELPSDYQGLEFQSQALQMSKVNLSWDDDEPHRVKTLNQKFKDDQLAALEMKEYIASSSDDESESEDENANKKEKGKEKYRALLESNKDDDEEEEEEENGNDKDMDMEVTFHTGLEDLGKQIIGKKDKKNSESLWEKHLRERSEKKKAKKKDKNNKQNDDSSDDESVKEDDDFFVKEDKPKKKKKTTKKEEVAVEEERSRAELELLLADENGAGEGLKGYNIKKKGSKKGSKENVVTEDEKMPAAELDEPRFAAILSDPRYALDPTDPQFKRSATYVRQLAQKQKEVPTSHDEVKATSKEAKPEESKKKEGHEMSSTIKSVKMKMKNQQKDKKEGRNAESSTSSATLARIKKKVKDLSKK